MEAASTHAGLGARPRQHGAAIEARSAGAFAATELLRGVEPDLADAMADGADTAFGSRFSG